MSVFRRYLDGFVGGSGEEQVSGGVDAQAPHGALVADKRALALEDLLRVVRCTERRGMKEMISAEV